MNLFTKPAADQHPAPRPEAMVGREASQRRKWKILPVGNTRHAFGADETVLPSGKSCSWCGSVLENTNGSLLEPAEA